MSGVTSTGWVGIGWNTKGGMPNTDMVVGWLDSTGAAVALDTWATKRDIPTVDTALGGDSYLFNVSGLVEKIDGKKWMTISFTRPLQITDKYDISIADQQYHMLWAVGPDASVNYAAKTYNQHSTEGEVLVNFFSSNALCEAASAAANPYFKAHGILMISGWTMMLFVGTYIARYMKPVTNLWFKVHVALQTIGCFAVIAAFVLILVFYNGGFTVGWHQMIGLFVVIGTVVQPIIGAIADKMYDPARSKVPVWPDQIHWWIGRGTSLLALAAIFLGIWVYMPTSLVSYILFAAYCLLTFIIILVSELKVGVKHENEVYTEDMQIAGKCVAFICSNYSNTIISRRKSKEAKSTLVSQSVLGLDCDRLPNIDCSNNIYCPLRLGRTSLLARFPSALVLFNIKILFFFGHLQQAFHWLPTNKGAKKL